MQYRFSANAAPALGDVRAMGPGDSLLIFPDANQRADWSRYADAIGGAVSRGADAKWVR